MRLLPSAGASKSAPRLAPSTRACLLGLLLSLAAGLATGCGGGSSPGDPARTISSGARGASAEVDLGDFPLPAPPGGSVGRVIHDRARGITYPAAKFEEIAEFYEGWIADNELEGYAGTPATVTINEVTDQITGTVFNGDEYYTFIATRDGAEVFLALLVQEL